MSYILATRKHTEFLRHAVSSILFSTKYNLFHNFLFFFNKTFFYKPCDKTGTPTWLDKG